ncbi:hypothetical protein PsYK624_093310 [Phanerochaete sordida]|uniref:Uncharacterized protein n=1 Tax=Phanerochaete sordida TaxID=48140 RepID=A0A9P3GCE2_9APHY|nr:hypothetical protein PsYK624_093310 [Phanerochaete sordida]
MHSLTGNAGHPQLTSALSQPPRPEEPKRLPYLAGGPVRPTRLARGRAYADVGRQGVPAPHGLGHGVVQPP